MIIDPKLWISLSCLVLLIIITIILYKKGV